MADGSGLSDTLESIQLGDELGLRTTLDTGYEEEHEVDIIDMFYLEEASYRANDKIQFFATYWMRLYSECCLQKNEALDLMRVGCVDEAIKTLEDWPQTIACPSIPQLVQFDSEQRRRKVPRKARTEAEELIKEMEEKLSPIVLPIDVPDEFPTAGISLEEYGSKIQECEASYLTVENYGLRNAFLYGEWLNRAFERFQKEKLLGTISRTYKTFDEWVNAKCQVKPRRARQLRAFNRGFKPYRKVLGYRLPFVWFVTNGKAILEFFEAHEEEASAWKP